MKAATQKIYVLIGEKKPPSLILQSKDTPRRRLTHDVDGVHRPIRYASNQLSPYILEQTGEVFDREPIIFEDGNLIVPMNNMALINFLDVHPSNGSVFMELNHEKMAKDELEYLNHEADAMIFAKTADIEVLASALRILSESDVDNMSSSEIRRDALQLAKRDPWGLLEITNDPSMEIKNVCRRSISEGHLGLRNNNRDIFYNFPEKKSKLMSIPLDVNPYDALERYLMSDDGMDLYKALKKKLEIE